MKSRLQYWSRIIDAYIIKRHDSNLSFWHMPSSVNKLDERDIHGVRRYPMNFTSKIAYKNHCDADGVIMLNYHGNLGLQYNPNAIAQQALGYYDKFLDSGDQQDKKSFLTQADYFLNNNRVTRDDVILWEYNFPFEMRNNLSAPWRSALAQGQAISVLIRAHEITGNEVYAEMAHKGYKAFHYLAREHEGGVLDDQDGFIWLEEYILDPPNHVLNGLIWALWGIRDYAVYFGDEHARNLWEQCLETLEANLENYDLGFWTSYDWPRGQDKKQPVMPSSIYYQRLHAVQMLALYNLSRRKIFLEYHKKWQAYLESDWNKLTSQLWKVYFKLKYF